MDGNAAHLSHDHGNIISMKHTQEWFTRLTVAHRDLASGTGTILITPTARPATPEEINRADTLISTQQPNAWPLVEPFPGGSLTRIELDENTIVICLASDSLTPDSPGNNPSQPGERTVTAITCSDTMDADSIYAHAATTLGILTETCAGCGAPIPAVYEICANCV